MTLVPSSCVSERPFCANCNRTVYAATGQVLASNVMFDQESLSLRTFEDVLSLLGVTDHDELSASFSTQTSHQCQPRRWRRAGEVSQRLL